jgi:ribosomal protein S13
MIGYLKGNKLVDPEADEQEIEGFLTRQISAKNAYEFYALLRHESELAVRGKRRKRRTAH